jgi:uncharacterized membrane protein YfcA
MVAGTMDGLSGLMLFGAGLAGGMVTAVVGGASLSTFPALLAAGLPPTGANASNAVALMPGNFVAGIADVDRRPRWDRSSLGVITVGAAGSVVGAGLLLVTPDRAFTAVVPLLIGPATILFAGAGRIRRWSTGRRPRARGAHGGSDGLRLLLAPVAVYGGYFGAGLSVMLLAVLSISNTDEFRTTNVIKNQISGLTSLVAVVVFVYRGTVAWPPTVVMMAGALVGGFLGGRLARVLPPSLIRGIVITVGAILTVIYGWRYWLR